MDKIEVRQPTPEELEALDVTNWGTWSCEVSKFDWSYDMKETCFILEGDVIVSTEDGETQIQAGDLVMFPSGLHCIWDVKKPVRKHFRFD